MVEILCNGIKVRLQQAAIDMMGPCSIRKAFNSAIKEDGIIYKHIGQVEVIKEEN